jgi:hypothetical protein
MRREKFIEEYARSLNQGNAGLFVGAGLSMRAGYPSWKGLVRDMAGEIGLDVEQEPDLAGVVQYFLNRAGKTRTRLARVIKDELGPEKPIPRVLETLARLPLKIIWTTNYDTLLERAWGEQRLHLEVNTDKGHIINDDPAAHAQLYKMHGSVHSPSDVVIAKGDYENYRRERGEFLNLLHSHLVSRRLLFLGFSFTDPNLSQLFTLIRESFGDTPPEHYAVVLRPQRDGFKGRGSKANFEYAIRRHELWVEDLQNYGINSVELDDWNELDELIDAVERKLASSSVMVSGSYPDDADPSERHKIETIALSIGKLLARDGYRLVSGFGLVVGSAVLSGVVEEVYKSSIPNLEKCLFLRPFPRTIPAGQKRDKFYERYREDLIRQAGVCIYISGLKRQGNSVTTANGVLAEYEISKALGRIPIPIGATGGAAAEIWNAASADFGNIYGKMPRRLFDELNKPFPTTEKLVEAVDNILKWLKKNMI